METVQSICIEEIPLSFREDLNLPINGGNCFSVEKNSKFGKFLATKGFTFNRGCRTWDWIVVFR